MDSTIVQIIPAHGLVIGDKIQFNNSILMTEVPGYNTDGAVYYVESVPTTLKLATSLTGSAGSTDSLWHS